MIRVLLADDQLLFREGLRTLLSVQAGIEVIGEASDGEEAIQVANLHKTGCGIDGCSNARFGWRCCHTASPSGAAHDPHYHADYL